MKPYIGTSLDSYGVVHLVRIDTRVKPTDFPFCVCDMATPPRVSTQEGDARPVTCIWCATGRTGVAHY